MIRNVVALVWMATSLAAPSIADAAPEPGVYWEQTVETQMAGFSAPAQTIKFCMPKRAWEEPPPTGSEQCKITDLKKTGSRMQWKIACADGTTGKGDITHGPDSYTGTMEMRTGGNEMRVKMKGRRLGGDCDASEIRRQAAKARQGK